MSDNDHPQAGGSYVREKDGGALRKVEGTEPAPGRESPAVPEPQTSGAARRKPTKES